MGAVLAALDMSAERGGPTGLDREAELLPAPYYHIVFTLPASIGAIAFQNKAAVYDLPFRTAAETLTAIAADPKHLGLSQDGARWIPCKPGFFLPVRVLSRRFRRLFLDGLAALHAAGRLAFLGALAPLAEKCALDAALAPLRCSDWFVYAKRPFAGPQAVLAYLARYTHRVAISNSRLISSSPRFPPWEAFGRRPRHLAATVAKFWADTTTPHDRLMLTVLGGLAEFERELIRTRTGKGRARAKTRGVHMGRPPKLTAHQKREALNALADGSASQADLARRFNVSQATISRLGR